MKISQKGINHIKNFEGCKLKAYRDSVGIPTIGIGHIKGVKMGMTITQEQAEKFLKDDIAPIEKVLNNLGINFTQGQFDAICSWIFNLGTGSFNTSTMKKYIIARKDDIAITDQMIKWHNAGGKPLLGLKRRRVVEANMFLGRDMYYIDTLGNIKKTAIKQ
jgi:lysozyme